MQIWLKKVSGLDSRSKGFAKTVTYFYVFFLQKHVEWVSKQNVEEPHGLFFTQTL